MSNPLVLKTNSLREVVDDGMDETFVDAVRAEAGKFFDREDGFIPERMGNHLAYECPVVVGEGARLYRYNGGVYRSDAKE